MLRPIKLFGEQKRVLFLPTQNPIQIKGVAGSGKTTVALYRAKHLVESYTDLYRESQIAIFTYNKSLKRYIENLLPFVVGGYQLDSDDLLKTDPSLNVIVTNFHKWAWDYLDQRGLWLSNDIIENEEKDELICHIMAVLRDENPNRTILNKHPQFYKEEIAWIKGKLFKIAGEYLSTQRIGRGIEDRVSENDKIILWQFYLRYQEELQNNNQVDFEDFAIKALEFIDSDDDFSPPFTHIVVDEAQDLTKAQMIAITRLVSPQINSITIIADAAQRIYKSGFSWSEVGINVKGGRTIEFKKNYRNTYEIAKASLSLLNNESDKSDFTTVEAVTRRGEKPLLGYFRNFDSQMNYVVSVIKEKNLWKYPTVLLHRKRSSLTKIYSYLYQFDIPCEIINRQFYDFQNETIKICTLSSTKGLEFDYVFIIDLNDDIIPYPDGFSDDNDEFHISTERRLLYTAMTRAREGLFLLSSGEPSRYLHEIDEATVEIMGNPNA